MDKIVRTYNPEPTLNEFHKSNAFYRGIMGPVRSGKSTGMTVEGITRGLEQRPGPDGVRHTRGAIIRNTYRELQDTTLKTWLQWADEEHFGQFNYGTMTHRIQITHKEFGPVDMEILFRALDRPADIKKLLSLELTWAWVNEAREIPEAVIFMLGDRVGQYPPQNEGGCTWRGVFMDTNAMTESHWWYIAKEKKQLDPKIWRFFRQPGGLVERDGAFFNNPRAENLSHIEPGYYQTRMEGKSPDYTRVYYCCEYGFTVDGRPVHPDYVDSVHCPGEDFKPVAGLPIIIGLDFGHTPAAAFLQRQANGSWICFNELISNGMGISTFADQLKPMLQGLYKGWEFEIYGDPAGTELSQTDYKTPFQILNQKGIPAVPAWTNNDPTLRREALAVPLRRLIGGKPGFLISNAPTIRTGLMGGFCYKKINVVAGDGTDRYQEKPDKNMYSHPVEACEYGLLGAGEGKELIASPVNKQIDTSGFRMPRSINTYGKQGWMA